MNKTSRRITLVGLLITVGLIGVVVFVYRKPIMESYWLNQLEDEDRRIEASRKLAELKCYRAIPRIVEVYEELKLKSEEVFLMQTSAKIDSKTGFFNLNVIESKLHPLLYSIFLMGSGGHEVLYKKKQEMYSKAFLNSKSPYWVSIMTKGLNGKKNSGPDNVIDVLNVILQVWENDSKSDFNFVEGPEFKTELLPK